ncbi:P-loop containing nucleoside triphosphate hydrolase protein, partial [Fragilariopsis cylindrus CCMP1102]
VLNKINTTINPFELTAWMGPSGSGKTSLTSVVAGLIINDPNSNDITKESKIQSTTVSKTGSASSTTTTYDNGIPKQMIGVVWQDDLLLDNLTVEETIYFAARLKTPSSVSDQKVTELVVETMKELNLTHIRHNIIKTISGGERKRLSVGVELVTRPSLLICDEPTSGLDSSTAYKLIVTLKELTSLGHSIAIVIHQPRTDIFNMFDHLLLLSKGSVIYNGKPSLVRSYLENIPTSNNNNGGTGGNSCIVHPLPPETGIADWIMDTIIDDEQNKVRMNDDDNCDGGSDRTSNSNNTKTTSTIRHRNNSSGTLIRRKGNKDENKAENNSSSSSSNSTMYEATFWKELKLLINRITKQQRGERITRVSFLLMLTYLTFTSFMWWQIPDTTSNIFERNSLLFFILIAQGASIVTSSISVFNRERTLLKRERSKKMYHVLPFFIAKMISDMTNNIALPLLYGMITYWTAGLYPSVSRFFKFIVSYWLTLNCAQSMGFFLSILIPNMTIALILAPPITLFCFILGGFYI